MFNYLNMEDAAAPLAQLFGQRLRKRRAALMQTQGMLSKKTGVAASYISFI